MSTLARTVKFHNDGLAGAGPHNTGPHDTGPHAAGGADGGAAEAPRPRRFERLVPEPRLVDTLSSKLVHGIATGRLPLGGRLIETEIADDFGISRVPLREALSVLESQGIITADVRRGRRVASYSDLNVREVCATRLALETLAVKEAARTYAREPRRIEALDAVLEEMAGTVDEGADHLAINQHDVDFHSEIYAATDNFCLQVLWDTLSRHVVIVFALETRKKFDAERNLAQHRRLRDLLLAGDEPALEAEIEDHIMSYIAGSD